MATKKRISKKEAALLKVKGYLVVDEAFAGTDVDPPEFKRRAEDFEPDV